MVTDEQPEERDEERTQTVVIMNNDEFLEQQIEFLQEKYDYETLKDLSPGGRVKKWFEAKDDFRKLKNRFPSKGSNSKNIDSNGYDYRILTPLSLEQKQKIELTKNEINRRIHKADEDDLKEVAKGVSTSISEIEIEASSPLWNFRLDIDFNN